MKRSQALRGRWIAPLLRFLTWLRVTPNQLTLLSLLTGLAFCPFLLWGSHAAACVMLLVHLVLDGMDGPLARHQGIASSKGSFTDTFADQLVVTASSVAMIQAGFLGLWPGVLYLFLYTLVVIFAMIRNALKIPYSWLVRPRMLVYGWFVVERYLWPDTLDVVVSGISLLLALKTLTGFLKIRRRM